MPIRVSDSTGSASYSNLAAGLNWAADHGARVANISYIVSGSATVTSAAQYMQSRGGVTVSSAGNYSTFDSSADNPYILTVTATDPNDVLYSWSNTGNNVDLAAPGCVYTTNNSGGYSSGCGTSFSAPIVAGVAALVQSVNPGLTPSQLT
jgi:subtilisin family serine protease